MTCDVLLAPHHGSRGSSSTALLAASRPQVTLVPAGPHNLHYHPHTEVLDRLRQRRIPFRIPARDGWCGAAPGPDGRWRLWP